MKYLTLIVIIAIFYSCDTRKDKYKELNIPPKIMIKKIDDISFSKSLTDSLKLNFQKFTYEYKIENETQNILSNIYIFSGTGVISDSLTNYKIYTPTKVGDVIIFSNIKDLYGETDLATISLTVFENLNPVCNIEIEETNIFTQMEFVIDLSSSYDKDARFGGKIVLYEYKIGGNYFIQSTHNRINYIFESPGTYVIKVRVKDNNNVWSDQKIKIVNVNQSK